jgi:hypothetical protein
MKRLGPLLIVSCWLLGISAFADTPWYLTAPPKTAWPTTTTKNYVNPDNGTALSSTESDVYGIVPVPIGGTCGDHWGRAYGIEAHSNNAPGTSNSGKGWVLTFRTGAALTGTIIGDTNVYCTIFDANQDCSNELQAKDLYACQYFSVSIEAIGTPAGSTPGWIRVRIIPDTAGQRFFSGSSTSTSLGVVDDLFLPATGSLAVGAENSRWIVMPSAGTVRGLVCDISAAPGGAETRTFSISVTGSIASAPSVVIDPSETREKDTSTTLAFAAGDTLAIRQDITAAPATATGRCSFVYTLTNSTSGDFVVATNTSTAISTTAERWLGVAGMNNINTTSEAGVQMALPTNITLLDSYYKGGSCCGGAGKQYTITFEDNANPASEPFTITVNNGAGPFTSSPAGPFTPVAGHLYNSVTAPVNSPTSSPVVAVSYLANLAPYSPTFPATTNQNRILIDFSAAADETTATGGLISASSFGSANRLPCTVVNGSAAFQFETDSHTPVVPTPAPAFATNPWPGNTGTTGLFYDINSTTFRSFECLLRGEIGPTISMSMAFRTSAVANNSLNKDSMRIGSSLTTGSSNGFINSPLTGVNGHVNFGDEIVSPNTVCNTIDLGGLPAVESISSTGMIRTMRYVTAADTTKGFHIGAYNYNWATGAIGSLFLDAPGIGNETKNAAGCDNGPGNKIAGGWYAVADGVTGINMEIGWVYICLDGEYPCLPSVVTTGSPLLMMMSRAESKGEPDAISPKTTVFASRLSRPAQSRSILSAASTAEVRRAAQSQRFLRHAGMATPESFHKAARSYLHCMPSTANDRRGACTQCQGVSAPSPRPKQHTRQMPSVPLQRDIDRHQPKTRPSLKRAIDFFQAPPSRHPEEGRFLRCQISDKKGLTGLSTVSS